MTFKLPELHVNPPFSWGPPEEEVLIDDQPFQLHFKKTPLRAVDWLLWFQQYMEEETTGDKHGGAFRSVEDASLVKKFEREEFKGRRPAFRKFTYPRYRRSYERPRKVEEMPSTIPITDDLIIYAEFPQNEMLKHNIASLPHVEDLLITGHPFIYDSALSNASCLRPVLLDESNYSSDYFMRPPSLDEHMQRLITETRRPGTLIVTTDEVLSLLMSSYASVHPWHVVISHSRKHKLFVLDDEGDESNVDRQWVSETAARDTAPSEDDTVLSERISSLGEESTKAHNCFVKQSCLRSHRVVNLGAKTAKNPFKDIHPRMYRYRHFIMHPDSPSDRYDLIVRCEVDAVDRNGDMVRLFGLMEQCSPASTSVWRKELDTNRAAALPMAYGSNKGKISRWIALSHLSDVKSMRVGFLARTEKNNRVNPEQHELVSVQSEVPTILASHLGVRLRNMWASVDAILQSIMAEGAKTTDMVLVKPSGIHKILLADKPEDADEEEEDEDEDDEDDDDG